MKHLPKYQELPIPLISGILLALYLANCWPVFYENLIHHPILGKSGPSLHFLVNEIFMAFFFGLACKEVVEELSPGGDFNPLTRVVNPLIATVGGIVGPIAVYALCVVLSGDAGLWRGWGIPTATDIALAWLVAKVTFGAEHPAVKFLLLLAIADDAIGMIIIGVFYPDPNYTVQPVYLLMVVAATVIAKIGITRGNTNLWWYLAVPGLISWLGFYCSHLHPALCLIPVVIMLRPRSTTSMPTTATNSSGLLEDLGHRFQQPVDFGMFFFGLTNAGIALSSTGPATYSVLAALVIGKTVGISGCSLLAHRFGILLPNGITPPILLLISLIASIGLTVSLFVAGVAFSDLELQRAAKMGALLSVLIVPLPIIMGRLWNISRIDES